MENQKKYIVLDSDKLNLYNIIVTKKEDKSIEYVMITTDNNEWTNRYKDKEVVKIIDDGNSIIKIKIEEDKIKSDIDCSNLECLRVLLNFIDKNTEKNSYKIIEDSENNLINL